MKSTTISRKHGKFQNVDGIWFYVDYNGKNGTVYNDKHIAAGLNGRAKPIIITDGDIFVFGCGEKAVISNKTVWAFFVNKTIDAKWSVIDTSEQDSVNIEIENTTIVFDEMKKGTIVEKNQGIVIYMGDLTYINGNVKVG